MNEITTGQIGCAIEKSGSEFPQLTDRGFQGILDYSASIFNPLGELAYPGFCATMPEGLIKSTRKFYLQNFALEGDLTEEFQPVAYGFIRFLMTLGYGAESILRILSEIRRLKNPEFPDKEFSGERDWEMGTLRLSFKKIPITVFGPLDPPYWIPAIVFSNNVDIINRALKMHPAHFHDPADATYMLPRYASLPVGCSYALIPSRPTKNFYGSHESVQYRLDIQRDHFKKHRFDCEIRLATAWEIYSLPLVFQHLMLKQDKFCFPAWEGCELFGEVEKGEDANKRLMLKYTGRRKSLVRRDIRQSGCPFRNGDDGVIPIIVFP